MAIPGTATRGGGLLAAVGLLVLVALVSVAVGSRTISLGTVLHELAHRSDDFTGDVIWDGRVPRTLLGIAVGAALGLAGALMQGLTRNPLADPGLLGVNAGAAGAVVLAVCLVGVHGAGQYVWFALGGAALAAALVYLLGARGRSATTPGRLVLAGAAITAVLGAVISTATTLDAAAFDEFRFWALGSLENRPLAYLRDVGPLLAAGAVLALALARPLNALALGEDAGRALGAHVGRTRLLGIVAVTLLCGAATAVAGPIGFLGLTVPHLARALVGPDQRWVLPYSAVLAPTLLLGADVLGRLVVRPAEIQVGIVTAFLGAPVLIALARRRRLVAL